MQLSKSFENWLDYQFAAFGATEEREEQRDFGQMMCGCPGYWTL